MTKESLQDAINTIRGAIMIAYPQGLPEGETVRDILEDKEELAGTAVIILLDKYRRPKKLFQLKILRFGGLERNWSDQKFCQTLLVKMKNLSLLSKFKE